MFKRIAFLIVFASLVLVACQPAVPPATEVPPAAPAATEPPAAPAATAEPPAKVYTYRDMTVGFLQTGSEGGWRAANSASFK